MKELLIVDEKYRQIVALEEVILSHIISDDYITNEVYDENYDNYKIIKDNNDEDTENRMIIIILMMIMKVQKLY